MPIYEFRCEDCKLIFEHLAMKTGDMLEVKCPACNSEQISRVMSASTPIVNSISSPSNKGVQVDNRSCEGSGSCASITLPGLDS